MVREILIFFASVFVVGILYKPCNAYISCYDCRPGDKQNCTYQNITQVSQKACILERKLHYDNAVEKHITAEKEASTANATAMCYSAFYVDENNPERSGTYRGCYIAETQKPCQEMQDDFKKSGTMPGSIKECHTCTEELCNTHHLNGASVLFTHPLILLLLSIILLMPVQF